MRSIRLGLIFFCLFSSGFILPAEEAGETPAGLNQKAYYLVREAEKALQEKDEHGAYEKYLEAVGLYRRIERDFPEWNQQGVAARIAQYQQQADALGEKIFRLPEGYVRIWPGMTREGKRYYQGQSLASQVKKTGENQYEVSGFTITMRREGPLLGAACTGPDFKYRGSKYNFACKHIWAVVLKENLLK